MQCLQVFFDAHNLFGPQQNHMILQLLDNDVVLWHMKWQDAAWMNTERKRAVCSNQVNDEYAGLQK